MPNLSENIPSAPLTLLEQVRHIRRLIAQDHLEISLWDLRKLCIKEFKRDTHSNLGYALAPYKAIRDNPSHFGFTRCDAHPYPFYKADKNPL